MIQTKLAAKTKSGPGIRPGKLDNGNIARNIKSREKTMNANEPTVVENVVDLSICWNLEFRLWAFGQLFRSN